jgi:hypothetical protein
MNLEQPVTAPHLQDELDTALLGIAEGTGHIQDAVPAYTAMMALANQQNPPRPFMRLP